MTRPKSIIGALMLCALSICAFAASSASASELTAVTCEKVTAGTGVYENENCVTPEKAGGSFKTTAIPLNTETEVTATSTEGSPTLRATIGGVNVTVICALSHLEGAKITNKETSAGKHEILTTATRNTYTDCHAVLKSNEARKCVVEEVTGPNPGTIGMISTNPLKGTTTGVEHQVKFEPVPAGTFAEFKIKKKGTKPETEDPLNECFFSADVTVVVTGSVNGEANTTNHAHLTFTEANNGTALKANGGTANYLDTVGGVMKGTTNVVGAQTFT